MSRPMKAAVALALFAVLLAGASTALAEEVVLASGARYQARQVVVEPGEAPGEGRVRFTVDAGGGRATLTLAFDRVEAHSLLALVGSRTDLSSGEGHLRLARLALARGLPEIAETRFRRAADLDPALAPARDEGLAAVRDHRARALLGAAIEALARGRSEEAAATAARARALAAPGSPLAHRVEAIASVAMGAAERDRARKAAEAAAAQKTAADAAEAAFEEALRKADDAVATALAERGKAADPNASAPAARRALETAQERLAEARRRLAHLVAAASPRQAEAAARDAAVVDLLVATCIDLADLHREARRFSRARDYARAAQVLRPDDPRVREVRDRIDRDAATPPPWTDDPWLPWGATSGFSSGWTGVAPWPLSSPRCYPPRSSFTWRWSHGLFRLVW